ncbi:hypothetical protein CO110_07190 [Candidatus Desantisbacteria bacterium CG_4_9_14_3_um_filter_40_11]|uniref:MurNAc-LAA domain-containing protein n=2 Tax=unclassified Candidatus Desantisiibacteriota TaxID=3106372 RepID=A0A2M7NZE9_9BACT|nr:MAG: hypothetical protein COZ13_09985 [Candidatus Desantisbacteria bacterium CG_4_10_14_3_um_filter_40_18]PJB29176.1 MAG: hypothetical protein CO110_07190 [Candidatus Desantisbacteria bacterium CG_4_9_14_3_um_filter_40_11]
MYKVKFYKGEYRERQKQANDDKCVAYVEQHFNSAGAGANYTVVITGSNASSTSMNWGQWYAGAVSREFNLPLGGDKGVMKGGYDGRGDGNIKYTNMPAILLEPLFVSNPQSAALIRTEQGQMRLAHILCESVQRFFQNGGLIGFSVGHKYKISRPNDRGADVVGGGSEADYAETVLLKAKALLEAIKEPQLEREIKIMRGTEVVYKTTIDADTDVRWDGVRGILNI